MNIDEIVAYMIDELKSLPEGTELSSGRLMNKVLPLNVHDLLRFEIDSKFRSVAWENGFYLNSSLYYRIPRGLPFNCTFFLKKKKEEKKFDLLRWRMCSDVDSGMIVEINLHKKTVSYFHTPETVDPDIHQCSEDVYEKLLLPMKNITNIYFSEGGFYGTDTHYELSFLKKQLTCKKETEYRSGKFRKTVFSFSKEEWQNTVLPALRKCNLFAWHTSYKSPDAFDEPQWQMTLYCKKKKIYFSGNDYPEEWEHWQEFLRLCTTLTDVHKETNEE